MLPELCLAPHEVGDLAPGEPLCAPADRRARAGRWRWALYSARWIRLANGTFDLVARREAPGAPLLRFAFGKADKTSRGKTDLAELIGRWDYVRCLFFGADQDLIKARGNWRGELVLSPDGQSCFRAPDGEVAPFRWHGLGPNQQLLRWWLARASDAQIEIAVREMLKDGHSDCAFAWAWLHRSAPRRARVWVRANHGDLDECERITRAIAVASADADWQNAAKRTLIFEVGEMKSPFVTGDDVAGTLFDGVETREFSALQNRLFALVFAHFGLNLNAPMENYATARHISHAQGYAWRLSLALSSQHERLEARLQLREFLRDKVSSAELTELMREMEKF